MSEISIPEARKGEDREWAIFYKTVGITTRKQCRELGLKEFDLKPLYETLRLK